MAYKIMKKDKVSKELSSTEIAREKGVNSTDLLAFADRLMITFSDIDSELRKHTCLYWLITSLDEQIPCELIEETSENIIKGALEEVAHMKECPIAILVYNGLAWKPRKLDLQKPELQEVPQPCCETHLYIWLKKLL